LYDKVPLPSARIRARTRFARRIALANKSPGSTTQRVWRRVSFQSKGETPANTDQPIDSHVWTGNILIERDTAFDCKTVAFEHSLGNVKVQTEQQIQARSGLLAGVESRVAIGIQFRIGSVDIIPRMPIEPGGRTERFKNFILRPCA